MRPLTIGIPVHDPYQSSIEYRPPSAGPYNTNFGNRANLNGNRRTPLNPPSHPPSGCCANNFGRAYRSSIRCCLVCCRSDTRRHCLDSGTPLYQSMTISNTHADHHHHSDGYVVCPVKAYFVAEFHLLCRGVLSKVLALLSDCL